MSDLINLSGRFRHLLDVDAVIAAIETDIGSPPVDPNNRTRKVIRDLITELPDVLEDRLRYDITVESLLQTKIMVTHSGFMKKLHMAKPGGMRLVSAEEAADDYNEKCRSLIAALQSVLDDGVAKLLAQEMQSEAGLLRDPEKFGLSGEAMALYDAGELTIAKLLETQPSMFLQN